MTRIIVSGALANKHRHGGEAWVRLSWALGLRALGCDVRFVEQIARESCVDGDGAPAEFAVSANLAHFRKTTEAFGLAGSAALIHDGGRDIFGATESDLIAVAADSDLLVNISGHLTFAPIFERVRRRVFIDIDPGFTQFWHASGNAAARLAGHDRFFTIGENIGAVDCPIPTAGMVWHKVRPPVLLDQWPAREPGAFQRFTTIASWRGPFGSVEFGGVSYGLKVHQFRKFLTLPCRTGREFEIALEIHPAETRDLAALREHGWRLSDPQLEAGDAASFREYVRRSSAEFSVAQGIYVQTQSGWFSDRTAHYLASGRPALVQDTGFTRHLPIREGLLAFRTLDEAAAGADAIATNYAAHCRAAREMAVEFFDSSTVLTRFLECACS